jgi:hypothetical protein
MHVLFIVIDCGFLEFFRSARHLYYYMPLHLFTVAKINRDILIIQLKVVNKGHNRKFYSFFQQCFVSAQTDVFDVFDGLKYKTPV